MQVACCDFDNRLRLSNFFLSQHFRSRPQKHAATLNSLHSVSTSMFSHNRFFLVLLMFLVTTSLLPCCPLSLSQLHILSHDTYHLCGDLLFSSVLNFGRDRKIGSRPQLIFLAFLLVATPIFSCNHFPYSSLYSRS